MLIIEGSLFIDFMTLFVDIVVLKPLATKLQHVLLVFFKVKMEHENTMWKSVYNAFQMGMV